MQTTISEDQRGLLERLLQGPIGKQMLADQAQEKTNKRKAAVAEIVGINAEREKQWPVLAKAIEQAEAEFKAAEKSYNEARQKLAEARIQNSSASNVFSNRVGAQERILRELTPACVGDFENELRELRRQVGLDTYQPGRYSPLYKDTKEAGEREAADWTENRNRRLAAIDNAFETARTLHLTELSDDEIQAKINETKVALGKAMKARK